MLRLDGGEGPFFPLNNFPLNALPGGGGQPVHQILRERGSEPPTHSRSGACITGWGIVTILYVTNEREIWHTLPVGFHVLLSLHYLAFLIHFFTRLLRCPNCKCVRRLYMLHFFSVHSLSPSLSLSKVSRHVDICLLPSGR